LNATNVLTTLNEESEINDFSGGDSDFDTRCQPLLKKIAGSLISYVEKYLPDLHLEEAALYTNMHALSAKGKEFRATANEIKNFYVAQALMGIINPL
ncbi:piggyBac transposable element-derived protein 3-like, partial [Aphis craccivora]